MKISSGFVLASLLKRVHLKGIIEECVLVVKKGIASVEAIDTSNTLFVSVQEDIKADEDLTIGIGNLSTMCRYLEGSDEVSIKVTDNWITVSRKGFGHIRCQLLQVDEVPTAVKEKNVVKNLLTGSTVTIPITLSHIETLSYYTSLIGSKSIVVSSGKDKGLYMHSNQSDPQQFKFKIAAMKKTADIRVEVFGDFLLSALQAISPEAFAESGKGATLGLADKRPIIINHDDKNVWALSPVNE